MFTVDSHEVQLPDTQRSRYAGMNRRSTHERLVVASSFPGRVRMLPDGVAHRHKLGPERLVPPTKRQFWTAWIPGEFTARGRRLRRRITLLGLAGAILLGSALVV